MIILFTWFIPDSPRWLLSQDRDEDAIASLRRLRTRAEVAEGRCEVEIQDIRDALQSHVHKGSWLDLLRGANLRRTMIVIVYYFFQQASLHPATVLGGTNKVNVDLDYRASLCFHISNYFL